MAGNFFKKKDEKEKKGSGLLTGKKTTGSGLLTGKKTTGSGLLTGKNNQNNSFVDSLLLNTGIPGIGRIGETDRNITSDQHSLLLNTGIPGIKRNGETDRNITSDQHSLLLNTGIPGIKRNGETDRNVMEDQIGQFRNQYIAELPKVTGKKATNINDVKGSNISTVDRILNISNDKRQGNINSDTAPKASVRIPEQPEIRPGAITVNNRQNQNFASQILNSNPRNIQIEKEPMDGLEQKTQTGGKKQGSGLLTTGKRQGSGLLTGTTRGSGQLTNGKQREIDQALPGFLNQYRGQKSGTAEDIYRAINRKTPEATAQERTQAQNDFVSRYGANAKNSIAEWNRADLAGMMGSNQEPDWRDVKGHSEWMTGAVRNGMYDSGNNVNLWSMDRLLQEQFTLENQLDNEKRTAEQFGNEMDQRWAQSDLTTMRGHMKALIEGTSDFRLENMYTGKSYNILDGRPDDYSPDNFDIVRGDGGVTTVNTEDLYDSQLYDFIYGKGAYTRRVNSAATEDERNDIIWDIHEQCEDIWNRIENPQAYGSMEDLWSRMPESKQLEALDNTMEGSVQSTTGKKLEDIYNRINSRKTAQDFEYSALNERPGGPIPFDPRRLPRRELITDKKGDKQFIIRGGEADLVYYYANVDYEDQYMEKKYGVKVDNETGKVGYYEGIPENAHPYWEFTRPEMFMDQRQKDTFNTYYLGNKPDQAMAYLESIMPELEYRQSIYNDQSMREEAAGPYGWAIGLASPIAHMGTGVIGALGAVGELAGVPGTDKANSVWNKYENAINTYRDEIANQTDEWLSKEYGSLLEGAGKISGKITGQEAVADVIGSMAAEIGADSLKGVGKFLTNTAFSILDNMAAMGVGAAAGVLSSPEQALKFSVAVVQAIMSSEATASTMVTSLRRGMDPTEAALFALGTGGVEALTERYSVELLFNANVKEMLGNPRQIAKFFLKGTGAEGLEETAADVMGALYESILTRAFDDESELKKKYNDLAKTMGSKEAWRQVMSDWWEQVATDTLAGAISGGVMTGARIGSTQISNAILGSEISQDTRTQNYLKENAAQMGPDTNSRMLAEDISRKESRNTKVTNREWGNLAQNYAIENSESERNRRLNQKRIEYKDQLIRQGVEEQEADSLAKSVLKAGTYGIDALSTREQRELMGNETAYNTLLNEVYNEEEPHQKKIREEQQKEYQEGLKAIRDVVRNTTRTMATPEEIERAVTQEGGRTGSSTEVLYDGRFFDIDHFRTEWVKAEDENGKEYQKPRPQVVLKGQTDPVYLEDIRATNQETAKVLNWQREDVRLLGDNYMTDVVNQMRKLGDDVNSHFVEDALNIKMAAVLGMAKPTTTMNEQAASELDRIARLEQKEADTAAQKYSQNIVAKINRGHGTLTIDGVKHGTKAWNRLMKEYGIDKDRISSIDVAAMYIRMAGLHVALVQNEQGAEYGNTNIRNGVITIDINQKYGEGTEFRDVLSTLGHEMTHLLRAASADAFNELKSVIIQGLTENNMDMKEMILRQYMDYAGQNTFLDMDVAVEEIIANSCEQMFTSEEFKNRLQEKLSASTYGRIRGFIRGMLAKLNRVINNVRSTSSSTSMKLSGMREQIAKVWFDLQDRALINPDAQQQIETELENTTAEEIRQEREKAGEPVQEAFRKSMAGIKAQGVYGQDVRRAMEMDRQGYDIDTILEETGCIPGYERNGKRMWWKVLDNDNQRIRTIDVETFKPYQLTEILDAEELYHAYPELKKLQVVFDPEMENMGSFEGDAVYIGEQYLRNVSEEEAKDWLSGTLQHEIQHWIQQFEGSYRGSSTTEWVTNRQTGLVEMVNAEIMVKDIANRYHIDPEALDFIEFDENDNVTEGTVTPEVYQQMQEMDGVDLYFLQNAIDTMNKWAPVLNRSASYNYQHTVGEIEAEAARRTGAAQYSPINYEGAIVAEDFSGERVAAAQREARPSQRMEENRESLPKEQLQKDIRYSLADRRTREYLNNWANNYVSTLEDKAEKILKKYGIDPSVMNQTVMAEDRWNGYKMNRSDQKRLNTLLKEMNRWSDYAVEAMGLDEEDLGAQYVEAWRNFDRERMDQILLQQLEERKEIIGIRAPHMHSGKDAQIARYLKDGNPEAVTRAAVEMAQLVPKNAVLIPMPNSEGVANENMDTGVLAKRISELTGRPVQYALQGKERLSRKIDKMLNRKAEQLTAKDLGFRQVEEIPEGMVPVFVDNVVASGVTARAAHDAIGHGITLAYTYTAYGDPDVKLAQDTYIDPKQQYLIPLDAKYSADVKDRRYSLKMQEADYAKAVANNDMETTRQKLNETARSVGLRVVNDGVIQDRSGESIAQVLPGDTVAKYSLRSWRETNQDSIRDMLVKSKVYTAEQVDKWINDVNSIAAIIAADTDRLDYIPDRRWRFRKPNSDVYKYTLDASTLCRKRLEYQGTLNAIQAALPNIALKPGDLIELANMMRDMGHVTPCGICYVESNRRHAGNFSEEFIESYKKNHPDGYIPTLADLVSTDGLYRLRDEHYDVYKAYIAANNRRGSGSVKPVQMRTDYRRDLKRIKKETVEYLNNIGGLRIQSFSDFETPHLIDLAQALLDMSAKGLKGQAYTKVPDFAWVFGNTGIKINLSLMGEGNGLDADGNLIFSSREGMDFEEAMKLRNAYSDNVGTILVGMNDAHIIAAMGDERIDFIIPFHKSGWSQEELDRMDSLKGYKDFQATQNERNISDGKKAEEGISWNQYWDYGKTGTENAEAYLELCAKKRLIPKFDQFLVNNGDGTYSLPTGNSKESQNIRKGYWKTLIDFKMYNNEGTGVEQRAVTPDLNMEQAERVLGEYEGGANTLPVARDVVDRFVEHMKNKNAGANAEESVRFSRRVPDVDVNQWMMSLQPWQLRTEAERQLLQDYKDLRMKVLLQQERISKTKAQIRELDGRGNRSRDDQYALGELRKKLTVQRQELDDLEDRLAEVTGDEGYAKMMQQQSTFVSSMLSGKTHEQVAEAVNRMQDTADAMMKRINDAVKDLNRLAESEGVKRVQSMMSRNNLEKAATDIRKTYHVDISRQELMNEIARIRLEVANGEADPANDDIEALAARIQDAARGASSEYLPVLRGMTITLAPGQLRELKGSSMTIKDLRRELAGTGIKVKTATMEDLTAHRKTALSNSWDELCDQIPSLKRDVPAEGQVKELLEFIKREQGAERKGQTWEMGDILSDLWDKVLHINMNNAADPAMQRQLNEVLAYMQETAKTAGESAEIVDAIRKQMGDVIREGRRAAAWTESMRQDISSTVEYLNRTARMAQETARNEHLRKVIANLRSEAAQKILKNNEAWRRRIDRENKARLQQEDNESYRAKMNTVINRLYNRLESETDQKNIQEQYKGLARELISMFHENNTVGRKLLQYDKKRRARMGELLKAWKTQYGEFDIEEIIGPDPSPDMEAVGWEIMDDLNVIRTMMKEWNSPYHGEDRLERLEKMGQTLKTMQEAVSDIYGFIRAAEGIFINGKRMEVADLAYRFINEAQKSRFRGDRPDTKLGKAMTEAERFIKTGNVTPVYFMKNLMNAAMNTVWEGFKGGENKSGLAYRSAMTFMDETAKKYHYENWDMKKLTAIPTMNGTVNMTVEQMMALYAIWKREQTQGPVMSEHLAKGGFVVEEEDNRKVKREKKQIRPHRLEASGVAAIDRALTQDQKNYMDAVVAYMSNDMSRLGNETSMQMYGIKKYTEKYYFPINTWKGVRNFSSDKGSMVQNQDNRAAHKGWMKRRVNKANNAVEVGNFTDIATAHIVEMINYNTMAAAIENLNRVLNFQIEEGDEDNSTKRNVRMILQEQYGTEAKNYLEQFLSDLNGGAVMDPRGNFFDKLLSGFRKGAVAGSLSVAAQQPLSYIRAAMEINPIYLARALSPDTWKGSYKEMMEHSGVAVIKEMGRFDVGFGASAKEYIRPKGKQSLAKTLAEKAGDWSTKLPGIMDRVTWTRMWSAVKLEQKHLHPEMDTKSEEFLDLVAERFNEVMRRTQVYDSVMVKSSNMRSKNPMMKSVTSFMAEPSLSLNVLMDAARNIGQKGGKRKAGMAAATFLLSAIAQAAAKGFFAAGRTPDDKKTREENFLYRFGLNLMSEINPLELIPGYSDLIEILDKGELTNDAMTPIGKLAGILDTIRKTSIEDGLGYRFWEDAAGQMVQLFTDVPAKNIMRDIRAMINFFGDGDIIEAVGGKPYADRPTSRSVLKYQLIDSAMGNDLLGMINNKLGDAGYKTSNTAYYDRLYNAKKAGDTAKAEEITEYMQLAKGVEEKKVTSELKTRTRKDESLTNLEKAEAVGEYGGSTSTYIKAAAEAGEISTGEAAEMLGEVVKDPSDYVKDQLRDGKITPAEARKLLKQQQPDKSDDSIWWTVDRIEYKKETGKDAGSGTYYRLKTAIENNSSSEITNAVKLLNQHGVDKKKIKNWIGNKNTGFKTKYMGLPNGKEKVALKNALIMAYKAVGVTAAEANEIINKWK